MLSFSVVLLFCEVFYKAGEFNSDISKWDMSNVTDMFNSTLKNILYAFHRNRIGTIVRISFSYLFVSLFVTLLSLSVACGFANGVFYTPTPYSNM